MVKGCCKGCGRCLLVVVLMKLCSWRRRRTQRAKADIIVTCTVRLETGWMQVVTARIGMDIMFYN